MSTAPPAPARPTTRRATTPRPEPGFGARIRKELGRLWVDPPSFCRPGAAAVTDLFHWEVVIDGPDGSPYAGGTFPLDVLIPHDYPFLPPKLTFKTKVYHPNIDSEGEIILDIFQDNWSPAYTIHSLLLAIVSVLNDPLLDYPINHDIADQFEDQIELYENKARVWTRKYASTPIVSYYPVKTGNSGPDHVQSGPDHSGSSTIELPHERKARNSSPGHSGSSTVALPNDSGVISPLWRRAAEFVQNWSPCHLLRRS